jgi:predicted molibdopterin-dependent oxidoreductase YjgC
VPPDVSDSPTPYDTAFDRPGGRGHFAALPYKAPGDAADEDFPLVLVTGRILQRYNAGTMTRRTANARLVDRDVLEVHPVDAARLWIGDGDKVSVRSRVGRIEVEAKVTDSCSEYKVMAVDVRPISEQPSFVPVLADGDGHRAP